MINAQWTPSQVQFVLKYFARQRNIKLHLYLWRTDARSSSKLYRERRFDPQHVALVVCVPVQFVVSDAEIERPDDLGHDQAHLEMTQTVYQFDVNSFYSQLTARIIFRAGWAIMGKNSLPSKTSATTKGERLTRFLVVVPLGINPSLRMILIGFLEVSFAFGRGPWTRVDHGSFWHISSVYHVSGADPRHANRHRWIHSERFPYRG